MTGFLLPEEIWKSIFGSISDDPSYAFFPIVSREWMSICLTLENKPWIIEKDQLLKIPKRYKICELAISSDNIELLEVSINHHAKIYMRRILSVKNISSRMIDALIGRFGINLRTKRIKEGLIIDRDSYRGGRFGEMEKDLHIEDIDTLKDLVFKGINVFHITIGSKSIEIIKWRVEQGYFICNVCTETAEDFKYSLKHYYDQDQISDYILIDPMREHNFEVVKEIYLFFKKRDKFFIIGNKFTVPRHYDMNEYIKVLNQIE